MAHVRCDTDGTPFMIPASVTRDELNEALEPFYALLNITKNHAFDIPGITIGYESVTFVAPAVSVEDWAKDHPPANTDYKTLPPLQGPDHGGHGELMQLVRVDVEDDSGPANGSEESDYGQQIAECNEGLKALNASVKAIAADIAAARRANAKATSAARRTR